MNTSNGDLSNQTTLCHSSFDQCTCSRTNFRQWIRCFSVGFGIRFSMNGRIPRGGLVADLSNTSGQFSSRLEAFLRPHLDDSLRCRVKDGLVAADGLGLQAKLKPITFQPDVQLASTDAQLLTDHLIAHTTIKRSNLCCKWKSFILFSPLS